MLRLIVVCWALLAITEATDVRECKKDQPFPLHVAIEDCDQMPCDVYKGSTAVMEVHFVSNKDDVKNITAVVHATALGLTVPYPLPDDVADVCSNLMYGANCPIYSTEDVVYKFNFYVDNSYPEISVKVQLSLVDDIGESLACFVVDCKVRKGTGGAFRIEQLDNTRQ